MDIRNIIKSRKAKNFLIKAAAFLPDELYLRLYYFAMNGHILHLKNPKGYNEKLQWIKLHDKDKNPEHSVLVDKLRVRDVIEEKLGPGYSFPLLGYWESFDDIDFVSLPNEFALKCNHDSGSTKLIYDKSKLTNKDYLEMKKFYNSRLKYDFYKAGREYPYRGIKPYIIAEKMMKNHHDGTSVEDYKFFCFNGEPKILYVATERNADCKFDFYDMNFNHLDIVNNHPNSSKMIEKPKSFEKMKKIASILSKGIRHVRIDLYEIDEKIYFGEYTFFHDGGFTLFDPKEWEYKLGDWISLKE